MEQKDKKETNLKILQKCIDFPNELYKENINKKIEI